MVARLQPLEPPYDPEVERTLARLMGGVQVPPLALFRTVAHNRDILDKLRSTGSYLLNFGTLDPLEREVAILRTCARCGSEYEWGVHTALFAEAVGLTNEQVEATVNGDTAVWSERQGVVIRLVDELHDRSAVSEDLWIELASGWSSEQLVELVAVVGQYHAISYLTNAFRIELEGFAGRFPG